MTERYEDIIHNGQVVGQRLVSDTPLPTTSPRMTHDYFLRRFTDAEFRRVRESAATDANMADALFMFDRAKEISVEDARTQKFVHYMASSGYIGIERVPMLLAEAPLGEDGVL
jgi:hypothetical protein